MFHKLTWIPYFVLLLTRHGELKKKQEEIAIMSYPESVLKERSRCISFERLPIWDGICPKRLFWLKSTLTMLEKDEKSKLWSVPCMPKPGIFNSSTLPSLLQTIPYHLHGLLVLPVVFVFQEGRREWVWFTRVDFHFKSASISSFTTTLKSCCNQVN